jgi:hypothetical protein
MNSSVQICSIKDIAHIKHRLPVVSRGHRLLQHIGLHEGLSVFLNKRLLPALHTIVVMSVDRECKEILLLLERAYPSEGPVQVKAVGLNSA